MAKTAALPALMLTGALKLSHSGTAHADENGPVTITLEKGSKHFDIVSGGSLPETAYAQRGSIRFYRDRLDNPEEGFGYFFDGRSFQAIENLALIRKMPELGAWAIVGSRGWRGSEAPDYKTNPLNICEIEHHAVSWIPVDPKTKKTGERAYVLLDDIDMILWRPIDHWIANMSQAELKAARGTRY